MISIIIPTCNEAENIARLVDFLQKNSKGQAVEIIVADGASHDDTMAIAAGAGAVAIASPGRGRAAQMNFGATQAKGNIFYFVHADTFPPTTYVSDILKAIAGGYQFGRYRTRFDSTRKLLKLNAFFTRFDWAMCYGGDQTLFVTKQLFTQAGGFNADMQIMEEYELIPRLKQLGNYKIFNKCALVSARKYETNGWLRVQMANKTIVDMYRQGASQQAMVARYKKMLAYR